MALTVYPGEKKTQHLGVGLGVRRGGGQPNREVEVDCEGKACPPRSACGRPTAEAVDAMSLALPVRQPKRLAKKEAKDILKRMRRARV